ncbi:MAG TPA: endonuclease/exonuclease/phosphatase family protein [Anditalea sp.]|nr:endonuclease/exonuclease/phosphatase family protein [Anditalea sp.]
MKLIYTIILCMLFGPFTKVEGQTLNIATYNIRFDSPTDEGNMWPDRSSHLINLIKFHQMDIIGTQEGMHHQLEDVKDGLEFPYIGVGRDKGDEDGEFSAIFYNPSKIEVLEENTFWLSETPDTPSKGWDAQYNRVCTYGKFKHEEVGTFYVFNIHYDHMGQTAREESSKLLVRKIQEINADGLPVILMGDFNVTPDNPAYKTIISSPLQDSREKSITPPIGPEGTFNAFQWDFLPKNIIDHIFVSDQFKIHRHGILSDNYGKKYPSDHFPVLVEVGLK